MLQVGLFAVTCPNLRLQGGQIGRVLVREHLLFVGVTIIPQDNIVILEDISGLFPKKLKPSDESVMLEHVHKEARWIEFLAEVQASNSISNELKEAFHSRWVEIGHLIRKQVRNDDMLKILLKTLLPKYAGQALTLYRGENEKRFNSGEIGFCWTTELHVAEMFGRGLNACRSRGFLLQAHAPVRSIISGPNDHSRYLGENEFTIDPALLEDIQIINYYPRSH